MYALLMTNTDDRMLVIDVAYCIISEDIYSSVQKHVQRI